MDALSDLPPLPDPDLGTIMRGGAEIALGHSDEAMREYARAAVAIAAPAGEPNHLGHLLARIHRDGGQYQAGHGTEKAVADAEQLISQWLAELEQRKEPLTDGAKDAQRMNRESR